MHIYIYIDKICLHICILAYVGEYVHDIYPCILLGIYVYNLRVNMFF